MVGKEVISDATSPCCEPNDLVSQKSGILVWCLPTAALFVGLAWRDKLAWFWIPAFLIMGIGCLVNVRRCGKTTLLFHRACLRARRDLRRACGGERRATSPRSLPADYVRNRDACVSG